MFYSYCFQPLKENLSYNGLNKRACWDVCGCRFRYSTFLWDKERMKSNSEVQTDKSFSLPCPYGEKKNRTRESRKRLKWLYTFNGIQLLYLVWASFGKHKKIFAAIPIYLMPTYSLYCNSVPIIFQVGQCSLSFNQLPVSQGCREHIPWG